MAIDTDEDKAGAEDAVDRLRRVIQQADATVASWSAEKRRDATLTFYSRSSNNTTQARPMTSAIKTR